MSDTAIRVGAPAPDFTLPDENGNPVHLADFRGKRVVLYFYPKDDTPGCTAQACGFRDVFLDITEHNATVLGISTDDSASHVRFKTKYQLPFTLLADTTHQVAERYGVWGEQRFMGRTYQGITRSSFVIDEQGNFVDVQIKISPKESVLKSLAALGE
jgi:peroxiredoxin Q/BCP